MYDLKISGAHVVDGTGAEPVRADVAIEDGRIAAIGTDLDAAARVVDATAHYVCPGFVDPHTHYDAQLHWDAMATPSSLHGVTTVIGGNCGFTIAPLRPTDGDYIRRMLCKVEGMSLEALESAVSWDWESFAGFLDCFEGAIGVNAAFLVGHSAIRRYVLGEAAAERRATSAEVEQMATVLGEALRAGAIGFSTSRSPSHTDQLGRPVPSALADDDELLRLCAVVADHPATSLEAIFDGCLSQFSDAEIELMTRMSVAAGRPLNWNVLGMNSLDPDVLERQMSASAFARANHARVVALSMPIHMPMNMSFGSFCALWNIPGWGEILGDKTRVIERLGDRDVREMMLANARSSAYAFLTEFDQYVIGTVGTPGLADRTGRSVGELAAEQGAEAFDALVDLVVADHLQTVLWPNPVNDTTGDWERRLALWQHDDVVLGGSDAGAHLDRMCGAIYPTRFLGDCLRGRRLLPIGEAVRLLTDEPARLFGLRDRGRVAVGCHADLVVFDPATVDSELPYARYDLPDGSKRMYAEAIGIDAVYVNGVEVVRSGTPTGATPGTVLRAGRDTAVAGLPG